MRTYTEWPGAMSYPEQMGEKAEVVERPVGFFRDKGKVPKAAVLRFTPPPIFEEDRSTWLPNLLERIRERESEIRTEFKRTGRRFLGREAVLRQSPFSRPARNEPRRGLNPRVASVDKWKRIESLQRLKNFLEAYRAAWEAFCDGERSVIFPFGTYAMRVRFGVCCNGP